MTDLERHRKRQISSLAKTVCPLLQYQWEKGSTQRKNIKIKLNFNGMCWREAAASIKFILFLVFLLDVIKRNCVQCIYHDVICWFCFLSNSDCWRHRFDKKILRSLNLIRAVSLVEHRKVKCWCRGWRSVLM